MSKAPRTVTNKMKGGLLAVGLGGVFLIAATMLLDRDQAPTAASAFYVAGMSAIVIGAAVFLRDFRTERARRRHVDSKDRHARRQDWKPRVPVTMHKDGDIDSFLDGKLR